MSRFVVTMLFDNSNTKPIGYAVINVDPARGPRPHCRIQAQHESSLARARAACQVIADRLNKEADANRARPASPPRRDFPGGPLRPPV